MGLNLPTPAQLHTAAVTGLVKASEHLLQVSNTLVPIEEGTLERSGVASVDESALKAAVSYDGPYAVTQHESMDFRHPGPGNANPAGVDRVAKYLEVALVTEGEAIEQIIANEIRAALGTSASVGFVDHVGYRK